MACVNSGLLVIFGRVRYRFFASVCRFVQFSGAGKHRELDLFPFVLGSL